jgi:hypothetical protein
MSEGRSWQGNVRVRLYERVREFQRGDTRDWTPAGPVRLNPSSHSSPLESSSRLSA